METWTGFRSTYGACTERHLMAAGGHTWHETWRTTTVETHADDVKNVRVLLMQACTIRYGQSKFLRQTDGRRHRCMFADTWLPFHSTICVTISQSNAFCSLLLHTMQKQTVVVLQIAYICTRYLCWHWDVCRNSAYCSHMVQKMTVNQMDTWQTQWSPYWWHRGSDVMALACWLMFESARSLAYYGGTF